MNLTLDETRLIARIVLSDSQGIFLGMFSRMLRAQDVANRGTEGADLMRGQGRAQLLSSLIQSFEDAVPAARNL